MKKYLILLVAALSLAACEKDYQSVIEKTDLETLVQRNKVSLKQALLYAENSINGIKPTTRGAERKVKSTEIYVAKPATRSAEGTEVSFYLINYEDNQGFAMVSTDSRATPVYAYSDEGSLTAEDFETNPFLKIFIEGSIENYQIEVANNSIYDPIEWPDSAYSHITRLPIVEYNGGLYYEDTRMEEVLKPALLTTYWHQGTPYGDDCSNGIGGCGPIAAAQIMAYHKYPAQRLWCTYDWNAMTAESTIAPEDMVGAAAVAQLVHQIGGAANALYLNGRTSTSIGNIKTAFWNFSYNCSNPASYDVSRVLENINARRPIYIRGENSNEEHAWVIDGYHSQTFRTTYYYTFAPYAMYDTFVSSSRIYLHCNLGDGPTDYDQMNNNGYYYNGSFLHNSDLKVIYDITPSN